jgi:hypothetical protein
VINALIIFCATYCSVFAVGFQSRNVNGEHYVAAVFTSMVISFFNLVLFRLLPHVGTVSEAFAYCTGGAFGVLSAMITHKFFFNKQKP